MTNNDDDLIDLVGDLADTVLEGRAGRMTYGEAVRIRRDASVVERALPRLLADGRKAGRRVAVMAQELDITESYAYRLIREHKARTPDQGPA